MSTKTTMTFAEFAKSGPETDGFELVRGELVPMPSPRRRHGEVCANVAFLLLSYRKSRDAGFVVSNDTGMVTERDPDTVRGVDVAYSSRERPPDSQPDGYLTEPTDLVVEVRSQGQPWTQLLAKVNEYLQFGVKMVWIVDPEMRRLTAFELDRAPMTYAAESLFDGGEILPGLRFSVRDIFEP